jgi:serine/threonine protein kinase/tetratricopeptide (TPR) repeat protein
VDVGFLVAERFLITARAATGGMANVFRGVDQNNGQPVAIKVLAGDDDGRFAREVSVLSTLTHPGVVRYIAHGAASQGRAFLVMEWLEGETLRQRLQRGRMGIGESVRLVRALAEALGEAHALGVIHRDLKPSNVLLPEGGGPKLLDFGIAHLRGATHQHTRTGMLLGTPGYMAPEQARGEPQIDSRTDVFALGCLLFECVSGQPAFSGDHPMALLAKILFDEPPLLRQVRPDVPDSLERLVQSLLAKDRDERPQDAHALIARLEALGELGEGDPSLPRAPSITRGEQRLLSVVLAAADVTAHDHEDTAVSRGDTKDTTARGFRPQKGLRSIKEEGASGVVSALREAISPFGGRLERLADGSVAWTLAGTGVATDQAALAARCALSLRSLLPDAPMALVTGRGLVDEHGTMGRCIDQAAQLVSFRGVDHTPIRLDDTTAALLDSRFDVRPQGGRLALYGQRDPLQATRTLLGRATPCVGRDRELGTLEDVFDECVSEPLARAVLITAAPGMGKSRLRYEFLRRVKQPAEIWIARGDVMKAGSPFGLLAPALRRAVGLVEGDAATRRKKLRARVSRHVAPSEVTRVSAFLGEIVGVPFPDEESPLLRSARTDAQVMSDQIRSAFEDFLAAETQPIVLVIEDLHWGDLPSVKLVDAALRALENRPLMVLALARPEVHDLFPRLWSERRLLEVRLGPLTRRAAEQLGREALGDSIAPERLKKMVELADGNAFFLEELIRAVHEGSDDQLPETVLAMVQARLERLEPDARRVLRAASVFGSIFWLGGVEALMSDTKVGEWMNTLVGRELISRRGESELPNQSELIFRHSLLREAAYASLTADDRQLGHRLAAGWLEQAGESDAELLAEHWERGGERERAAVWYRRAAQQALEGSDLEAALQRATRGIDCGAEHELRGQLRLLQAEAHLWRGQYAEAERCALDALDRLTFGYPMWLSAVGLACQAASKLEHVDRMEELAQKLLALLPEVRALGGLADDTLDGVEAVKGDATAEAALVVAMSRCASQLFLHGRLKPAALLLDRLLPLEARFDRAPDVRAAYIDACAVRALYEGDLGGYLTKKELVVRACAEAGQARTEILQRVRLGYACLEIGAYDRAVRELEGALAAARGMSLHQATALAQHNLGLALARVGRLEEARTLELEAVRAFQAQGDARLERASRIYYAEIAMLGGDLEGAGQELGTLLEESKDRTPTRALALAALARVRVRQRDAASALEHADQAMAMLAEFGGVDEGEALMRLAHVEALRLADRIAEAEAALALARTRLHDRAARIADPALRRLFLEAVPENAETLAFGFPEKSV